MKCLDRNKRTIYYALYLGKTQIKDANGLVTGSERINYSVPIKMRVNVSAQKGYSSAELFGTLLDYTVTAITSDMGCPIDEHSVVWYEKEPMAVIDGQTVELPYNYVVVGVSRSLNNIAYALKKVTTNA